MKKNYVILAFLFSSVMFGQFTVYTNAAGAGDGKWSTATNWTGGALPTVSASIDANVNLDIPFALTGFVQGPTTTLSGLGKLTLTGAAAGGIIATGSNFTYNGLAELDSGSPTAFKNLQVNNTAATLPAITPNRQLTFGPLSVLTLTTPARVITQVPASSKVVFQGKIEGSRDLQINGTAEFDTTSDNRNFNGDMVLIATGSTVVANTSGVGYFLKAGRKVQVNNANCSLTVNGANSFNGNVFLSPATTTNFLLNINSNQGAVGFISVGNSPLTINVAAAVTTLSFADSSLAVWGTGTVAITGYQSGEIRFGTNNTALTATQLAKITADGLATGQALALDSNGYLVLASSLSSDSFDLENQKRISYPTVVDNQIFLSKAQNNVEIIDIAGKKIITLSNQNGIDTVSTSQLTPGIYFIVFDSVKVEKFIKK